MENEIILQKLNRIEKYIFGLKEILNIEELSEYTGFSRSYIYKLVHKAQIPYSKTSGKVLFFERKKIDVWLLQNSHKSSAEIEQEAMEYLMNKKS